MNWLDTPLLVYWEVDDHQARETIHEILRQGNWASSVLLLLELYQVLTRHYAVAADQAAEAAERVARSPLHWAALDTSQAVTALAACQRQRLQTTDAVLLLLAQEDGGTLVTQDQRLLRAAAAQGIAVRNPVTPALAAAVARWEEQHLPPRGLVRILSTVERWLRVQDAPLADQFLQATAQLTTLPL